MKQKNVTKATENLFATASRTFLTLSIEQVLPFVETFFSIIMEDIMKQKKNIYCAKDVLLEEVKMHVKEVVTPQKFSCDYTLLSTCKILLKDYLWQKVNEAEGEYIKNKLTSNDTRFAKDFFYGTNPQKANISRLRSRLKNEFYTSYGLTISDKEISTIIYSSIWEEGTWKGLKTFQNTGSIFSWIETKGRHELTAELREQQRIPWERKRTAGNTRLSKRKLTEEMANLILQEETLPSDISQIIRDLYVNKKSPQEIMSQWAWNQEEYDKKVKNATTTLKETLLQSPRDYHDILKDKTASNSQISLDEAMQNGCQASFKENQCALVDIFGVSLTDEEIQSKAMETIHHIASTVECTERDRYVWESRYFEDKSPIALSKELNMRRSNVDNIYLRMNKKFQEAVKEWYEHRNQEKIHVTKSNKKKKSAYATETQYRHQRI